MSKSACFTGHRVISEDKKKLSARLYAVLERIINEDEITDFYAGGAVGFDTIVALNVLRLKEKYNNIRLHLVLPCSNEEQTKNWTAEQKYEFKCILARADSVEYTSEHYHRKCMGVRNAQLVKNASDYCICYLDINHKSGTSQTVQMAEEKGLKVVNLFDTSGKNNTDRNRRNMTE